MKEDLEQTESVRRCKYCGCDTHEDVIKAAFWMDNGLIVVEDVPARLCEGCGEQFFGEGVTQRIQEFLKRPTVESERQIQVSVYDLPQLESMGRDHQSQTIKARKDAQASLQCKYCESETVRELVKSAFWINEQLIAIENIPAWVCQHCSVQFYDDETAETIATLEELAAVPDGATRDATASVFSLADKESAADNRCHEDGIDRPCE